MYSTKRDKKKVLGIYHMIAAIKCKSCPSEIRQAGQDNDIAFENAAELWNRRADNETD